MSQLRSLAPSFLQDDDVTSEHSDADVRSKNNYVVKTPRCLVVWLHQVVKTRHFSDYIP